MSLEDFISDLNKNIFWKEFSFSKNQFSPTPKQELEFTDHVVWIEDILFLFQLKERNISQTNSKNEEKWYKNKILGKAKKQITDTLSYLEDHEQIVLTNERGHEFNLSNVQFSKVFKIIIYAADEKLPEKFRKKKVYRSSKSGFIHLFPVENYMFILRILISLREIADYLYVRESIFTISDPKISEEALLGQFISDNLDSKPSEIFTQNISRIDFTDDFNLSLFFLDYAEKIEFSIGLEKEVDYYKILIEFAKLPRSALREAKKRLILSYQKAQNNEFDLPYRFYSPDTQCGFVFIPLESEVIDKKMTALQNYALGAKYDFRMNKQIGVSIVKKGEYFLIDWIYLEFPWQKDEYLEKMLKENYPFRPVSPIETERIKLKKD